MYRWCPPLSISCLLSMIVVRYAISGRSQAAHPVLHGRSLGLNSTVKVNESVARLSNQTYTSFNIQSNNVTAASTTSSDIGSCPQYIINEQLCALVVGDVDVYFWPDPSRDTSCLSIYGNATDPPMHDASTMTVYFPNSTYTSVYWGCTTRDQTSGESFITTAVLATSGTLSVKQYLFNPWSSQPCSAEALPSTLSVPQPLEAHGLHNSAHVRRHPLLVSSEITQNSGLLGATVTSGNFTL